MDGRTIEVLPLKLVFFSPTIAGVTGNLPPVLEEEPARSDIPIAQLLGNVSDPKVTSNAAIGLSTCWTAWARKSASSLWRTRVR